MVMVDRLVEVEIDGERRVFTERNLRHYLLLVRAVGVGDEDLPMHLEALSDAVEGEREEGVMAA